MDGWDTLNSNDWSEYHTNDTRSTYFPTRIFLNPLDGTCTHDCTLEGRNYKNPIDYNFEDVIWWPDDENGALIFAANMVTVDYWRSLTSSTDDPEDPNPFENYYKPYDST